MQNVGTRSTYCLAQVVTVSLPVDYMFIDLPCRNVVFSCQGNVQIPLVVAKVEVYLSAVVQDETFAMSVIVLSTFNLL